MLQCYNSILPHIVRSCSKEHLWRIYLPPRHILHDLSLTSESRLLRCHIPDKQCRPSFQSTCVFPSTQICDKHRFSRHIIQWWFREITCDPPLLEVRLQCCDGKKASPRIPPYIVERLRWCIIKVCIEWKERSQHPCEIKKSSCHPHPLFTLSVTPILHGTTINGCWLSSLSHGPNAEVMDDFEGLNYTLV